MTKTQELEYVITEAVNRIKSKYYLIDRQFIEIPRDKSEIMLRLAQFVCIKNGGVTVQELVSRSREKYIAEPRDLALYLTRRIYNEELPFSTIAKFYNRDHATVMYSNQKVEGFMEMDKKYKVRVEGYYDEYIKTLVK